MLDNQIAVVTGGGKGLGKAIAENFAEHGAQVILCGRNETSLKVVKEQLTAAGHKADYRVLDVTDEEQVGLVAADIVDCYQRIDILVNNAGISKEMPLAEMPMTVWDEIYSVNLRSAVLMIKAVIPVMTKYKNGNIINIASGAALRGLPGSAAYSASKAGVVALTQSLGDELRPIGIRVNVVCPGPIDTELFQKSKKRDYILSAGGDVFDPDTVANGVLYLASDMSKGMSSQTLTIRGFNRW